MSGKVKLERWKPHLAAAEREGKTLTAYARERGISRHTLYAAREMVRAQGEAKGERRLTAARRRWPRDAGPAFASVKVAAPVADSSTQAASLHAQLPNGVAVQVQCDVADTRLVITVLETLAGLRCFGSMRS
jgi:hypothetical protein